MCVSVVVGHQGPLRRCVAASERECGARGERLRLNYCRNEPRKCCITAFARDGENADLQSVLLTCTEQARPLRERERADNAGARITAVVHPQARPPRAPEDPLTNHSPALHTHGGHNPPPQPQPRQPLPPVNNNTTPWLTWPRTITSSFKRPYQWALSLLPPQEPREPRGPPRPRPSSSPAPPYQPQCPC